MLPMGGCGGAPGRRGGAEEGPAYPSEEGLGRRLKIWMTCCGVSWCPNPLPSLLPLLPSSPSCPGSEARVRKAGRTGRLPVPCSTGPAPFCLPGGMACTTHRPATFKGWGGCPGKKHRGMRGRLGLTRREAACSARAALRGWGQRTISSKHHTFWRGGCPVHQEWVTAAHLFCLHLGLGLVDLDVRAVLVGRGHRRGGRAADLPFVVLEAKA